MRKVAVVGGGQAGLLFAHTLLRKGEGYEVTIYSDRSAEEWLNHHPPTGTAFLFDPAVRFERELGLAFWDDEMFVAEGILLDFCPALYGEQRLTMQGRIEGRGGAVDQRLKAHAWLLEAEKRGAKVVIESVTAKRLDEIAGESDLCVIATGKADLARLIPRDAERSVYDKPQRNLAMWIAKRHRGYSDRVDFTPIKFNFFGDAGEYFWVPYTHKTEGPTWCVVFEAKAGSPLDKFGDVTSAGEMSEAAKAVIRDTTPWEWENVKDVEGIESDSHSWLIGRFPPTVREAYGVTESGHLVMPLGDTAMAFDPIAGQGGNCASHNAWFVAHEVLRHRYEGFDEHWMQSVREAFWIHHGRAAYTFNNLLLEPLTEAGATALQTACGDSTFATRHFTGNFAFPGNFFPWIEDVEKVQQLVDRFRRDGSR